MNLPDLFGNWQSLALALCIYALTEGARRFVQSVWKGWRTNKLYTEFLLWVMPMAWGAILGAFMRAFPWPEVLNTRSSRMVYGVVLGMFCTLVYNRTKHFLLAEGFQKPDRGGS